MTDAMWLFLPPLAAAVLSALLTPLVGMLAVRVGAIDMPGERKIHTIPVPRLGGLAVVVSVAVVFAATTWLSGGSWRLPEDLALGLAIGIVPILAVSVVDDIWQVKAAPKFAAHVLGASIAVALGVSLGPVVHLFQSPIHVGVLAVPLSILWIVGVTNAFNIIDGLDGLSAGLALISAVTMAGVFLIVHQPVMGAVVLVLAGALAGFLPYNTHPARLFLGDTGATAIGFSLAVFSLKGGATLSAGFAVLLPVFMLGLPIADTLIAMARRVIGQFEHGGGGMFVADRNHIHHRLLALGIDHGRAVLMLYGGGVVLGVATFVSVFMKAQEAALLVAALLLAGLVGMRRLGYDEFAFIRRGSVLKVYEMPVVKRGMFVVFVDVFFAIVAAYAAVGLKTDQWSLREAYPSVLNLASTFAPMTILIYWWFGMYRGAWRLAGLLDLTRALAATAAVTFLGGTLAELLSGDAYSLSLLGIYGLVSLLLTVSARTSYVVLKAAKERASKRGEPVLIYGAGRRGVAAVRELFRESGDRFRPIGFVDDDVYKKGRLVSGLPVFGPSSELATLIETHRVKALMIAAANILPERLAAAAHVCGSSSARMFRLNITVEPLGEGVTGEQRAEVLTGVAQADVDLRHQVAGRPARLRLQASEVCPACGGDEIHRSRSRNLYERFRKTQTDRRLFRCHQCGWRGWLLPLDGQAAGLDVPAPDLAEIDALLTASAPADDVYFSLSGGR